MIPDTSILLDLEVGFTDGGQARVQRGDCVWSMAAEVLPELVHAGIGCDSEGLAALLGRLGVPCSDRGEHTFLPLIFGDYAVVGLLGAGNFGLVVEARDTVTDERLVLKVLQTVDAGSLVAFKNEFRYLADLSHPSLIAPDEVLEARGRFALAMPLVAGREFGVVFAEAAGPAGPLRDEPRARGLVVRLLDAIAALHRGGLVHMDIKPGNVLVTADDAVRVLDFGLSRLATGRGEPDYVSGTPMYMSPEQLLGGAPAPTMDLYAVGVMLDEALTSTSPWAGSFAGPIHGRLRAAPRPLAERRPGLGEPWSSLCHALLARDPEQRPDLDALLTALAPEHRPGGGAMNSVYVGRAAQLQQLAALWTEASERAPLLVSVVSEPGYGKTELVRRFAATLPAAGPVAIAWGRCHEHEQLRFKALDGVIEQLCEPLRGDPVLGREIVQMPGFAPLRRAFPALDALAEDLAGDAGTSGSAPSAAEQDLPLGEALAGLVSRISARFPVLIVIDDAHWGDADSVELLLSVLTAAEHPRVLAVIMHRLRDWDSAPFAAALHSRVAKGVAFRSTRLELAGLSAEHATTLLVATTDLEAGDPRVAGFIAAADGSPLLLRLFAGEHRRGSAALELATLVAQRLARWPEPVRRFVASVVVADAATPLAVLAAAAGVPVPERRVLAELEDEQLVRRAIKAGGRAANSCHALVRGAMLAALDADTRARLHRGLADALAGHRGDPGVIAQHYVSGGDSRRAGPWALRGAEEAERVSAFARAAELWGLALECDDIGPGRRALRLRRAGAWLSAGLGSRAATAFYDLAQEPCDPAAARELLRRSAEAWMNTGEVRRGLEVLQPVLRDLQLAAPARGISGVVRLFAELAATLMKGAKIRGESGLDALAGERSDTCWVAAKGMLFVDPLPGVDFLIRSLRHGVRSGSPTRQGRAGGVLGAALFGQLPGLQGQSDRWVAALARSGGDAYLAAVHPLWKSLRALSRGALPEALQLAREALDRTTGLPDATWERVQAASLAARTLRVQGEYTACTELARRHLVEAERRGDLYAQMLFGDYQMLPAIARGAPAEARARVAWVVANWLPGRYTVQSFYVMFHHAYADLYEGRPAEAAARLIADRPAFRRAGGSQNVFSRVECAILEGRIALCAAAPLVGLRPVEVLAGRLGREVSPEGRGNAAVFSAALAVRGGSVPLALDELDRAIRLFDSAGISMDAQASRLRRAELLGEADQARLAVAQMRRLGASDPPRWADIIAPGFRSADRGNL